MQVCIVLKSLWRSLIKSLDKPNMCVCGRCVCIHCIYMHVCIFILCSSDAQSCPTLRDPMDCSMPGHLPPLPTPGVHPNSCPLSRWCYPTISSSVISFSSCPQSFPASGSFQMSQLSTSGGQSIGASASASVLPMNTQDWSPLRWTGWIFLQSKGLSRVFFNTTVQKNQFFQCSAFFVVQLSYPYRITGKTIALTRQTFVGKVMSLLFNMLSRLVIFTLYLCV